MKQTAVEWLQEKLATSQLEDMQKNINLWFQQAKEMEKQEIIESHISGMEFIAVDPNHYNNDAEQYYNETFNK